jgi:L-asparagine transporter-like permease
MGTMLIVMFTYAGFEIIGLAASEASEPEKTNPKAIRLTVVSLVGLYLLAISSLLPLIPTSEISEETSPYVAALNRSGMTWAGVAMNLVMITAILSTMLAAMFGLGRMIRSLADEGMAPHWVRDTHDVPRRGIMFSGASMLLGLLFGLMFPRVYLFLISSGGAAILFTYTVIMATHLRFRKKSGCPPCGKCQLWGYPYTSLLALVMLVLSIASMPFVSGQASGLAAGGVIVAFYVGCYLIGRQLRYFGTPKN